MASRSPPAIRPISTSSDVACIASDGRLVRLVAGERHRVHRSATIVTDAHTAFVPPPGGNPKRFGAQKCGRLGTSPAPARQTILPQIQLLIPFWRWGLTESLGHKHVPGATLDEGTLGNG